MDPFTIVQSRGFSQAEIPIFQVVWVYIKLDASENLEQPVAQTLRVLLAEFKHSFLEANSNSSITPTFYLVE